MYAICLHLLAPLPITLLLLILSSGLLLFLQLLAEPIDLLAELLIGLDFARRNPLISFHIYLTPLHVCASSLIGLGTLVGIRHHYPVP